ncbi:MAG: secondary thiamine-phosphate synthase enzyme YjbQ [Bacteroidales bacterium]|nr:secondary thiamine-phosphate synthase enzyme YjbQ [Bacteroidales bacterium]
MIIQKQIILPAVTRGYHLVTKLILDQLGDLPEYGILNLFLKHTSASLSINENADPSVRFDMEGIANKLIPENASYSHDLEGADDMPAHFKSSMLGVSLNIPIANRKLDLGTWQGIYLCEFRNCGGNRHLTATIYF